MQSSKQSLFGTIHKSYSISLVKTFAAELLIEISFIYMSFYSVVSYLSDNALCIMPKLAFKCLESEFSLSLSVCGT